MMRLAIVLITACVTALVMASHLAVAQDDGSSQLFSAFQSFERAIESDEAAQLSDYIAGALMQRIHDAPEDQRPALKSQLRVPEWFETIEHNQEGTVKERHCLTVDGTSNQGDRISAATEYVQEDDEWRIRAVEIQFLDGEQEFEQELWCPVRPEELQF